MLSRPKTWLAGSLFFGLLHPLAAPLGLAPWLDIAVKGAAVGLLAAAALKFGETRDHRQIGLVLALGALGDILIEIMFMVGVAAFAAGHVAAIHLYARNRREALRPVDLITAGLLPVFGFSMPLLILGRDHEAFAPLLAYSLLLTTMAAFAWLSRFPRTLTGLGAILFVASDGLIALRMSQSGGALLSHAIWSSYYAGQLLIFLGVMRTPGGARA